MPLTSELRHFARSEFSHPEIVNDRAAVLLDAVREEFGEPIHLTCAGRLPSERPPGSSPASLHLRGQAFDIRISYFTREQFWRFVAAVIRVAERILPAEAGLELELVWSQHDKHAHIGFFLDGRANRLIVAAD